MIKWPQPRHKRRLPWCCVQDPLHQGSADQELTLYITDNFRWWKFALQFSASLIKDCSTLLDKQLEWDHVISCSTGEMRACFLNHTCPGCFFLHFQCWLLCWGYRQKTCLLQSQQLCFPDGFHTVCFLSRRVSELRWGYPAEMHRMNLIGLFP